jgi:hypothetical protein
VAFRRGEERTLERSVEAGGRRRSRLARWCRSATGSRIPAVRSR